MRASFVLFFSFFLGTSACFQNQAGYQTSDQVPDFVTSELKTESDQELGARSQKNQALVSENKRLIEKLRQKGADVRGTDRGVVINLSDVLFEFDRYHLTGAARIIIQEISSVLKDVSGRSISIEGHSDSIGKVLYNKQLSLRRAEVVASELRQHGVGSSYMKVRGFGEGYPVASNNSEEGRSRNRRVEIVILHN